MVPAHPNNPGIRVSEETLKDPKELARILKSATEFGEALNRGVMEEEAKITKKEQEQQNKADQ